MPKYIICKECMKKKNIRFYRHNRLTCKKCEYKTRSEYLKNYQYTYNIHYKVCTCGSTYQARNKASHINSLKHKNYIKEQVINISNIKDKLLTKIIIDIYI